MTDPTLSSIQVQQQRLQGKVAIVTGGASGIGEATARLFVSHGAQVVIADIQDEKGRDVAASIGPSRCTYVHCDVSDEQQVKSMVESAVKTYGHLDIMFSNAGIFSQSNQSVLDLDLAATDHMFSINVLGMAACVKHAGRAMVEGGVKGGSIVCTASTAATMAGDTYADYTMSKHAVLGLVRSASRGLGGFGIRVNCVSPGPVVTPLLCNGLGIAAEDVDEAFRPLMSLNIGAATVKQVADAVLFLASAESEFVTGHNLAVDGGMKSL